MLEGPAVDGPAAGEEVCEEDAKARMGGLGFDALNWSRPRRAADRAGRLIVPDVQYSRKLQCRGWARSYFGSCWTFWEQPPMPQS